MKIKQLTFSFIGTIFRIVVIILLILFIYKTGLKAYDFGYRIFAEETMSVEPGRDVEVTITQDKSVMNIGKMLQEKGLIRDAQLFYVQEKLSSYKGKIQPGIYTLNTSMTAEDMLKIMAANAPEEGEDAEGSDAAADTAEPTSDTAEPVTDDAGGATDEAAGTQTDAPAGDEGAEQ